jgi:hypothetical protein
VAAKTVKKDDVAVAPEPKNVKAQSTELTTVEVGSEIANDQVIMGIGDDIPLLTEEEVGNLESRLKGHVDNVKKCIISLYRGSAHKVRGFVSWSEYFDKCLDEVGISRPTMYRIVQAEDLKEKVRRMGVTRQLEDKSLRELKPVIDAGDPEKLKQALRAADQLAKQKAPSKPDADGKTVRAKASSSDFKKAVGIVTGSVKENVPKMDEPMVMLGSKMVPQSEYNKVMAANAAKLAASAESVAPAHPVHDKYDKVRLPDESTTVDEQFSTDDIELEFIMAEWTDDGVKVLTDIGYVIVPTDIIASLTMDPEGPVTDEGEEEEEGEEEDLLDD